MNSSVAKSKEHFKLNIKTKSKQNKNYYYILKN